jgi:5-methylcytosine-specific restriction endonuclease McrBC regulatory subunit McrC
VNCILRKKAEDDKQVVYWIYPNDIDVPEEPGIIVIDKKGKRSTVIKKPKADEGHNVSLYTGLAYTISYRLIESGNYSGIEEGAW